MRNFTKIYLFHQSSIKNADIKVVNEHVFLNIYKMGLVPALLLSILAASCIGAGGSLMVIQWGCENFGYGFHFNLKSKTQKEDTGEILAVSPT